jgi:hypothetical protein
MPSVTTLSVLPLNTPEPPPPHVGQGWPDSRMKLEENFLPPNTDCETRKRLVEQLSTGDVPLRKNPYESPAPPISLRAPETSDYLL